MNQAKIRLSSEEMELVTNARWILTKNEIMKKAKLLLANVAAMQQQLVASNIHWFPPGTLALNGKISKGENYLGLPYLVLDYPRYFNKTSIFAIRTMFWWGNFFSVTLHLSGNYKQHYQHAILSSYDSLQDSNVYMGIYETEWEHHFENDNYCLINQLTKEEWEKNVLEKSFTKLAFKMGLEQWDDAQDQLVNYFQRLLKIINS